MIAASSGGWTSYAPADFVPYGVEVWFALIKRVGESFWPLQIATLALAIAIPFLLRAGRGRGAFTLLAAVWAWVGWAFLIERYSVLNWAGVALGWVFVTQAATLLVLAAGWRRARTETGEADGATRIGAAIALIGVVVVPLITAVAGRSVFRAEVFGLHPDPTAIATIGLALFGLRPLAMAAAVAIPTLWCALAGLHLGVLGAGWWPLPVAAVVCGIVGPLLRARARSTGS